MNRNASTLLELVVSIAVISLFIGLVLPAINSARSAASKTHCMNNLKNISLASQLFEMTHTHLPPAVRKTTRNEKFYHLSWLGRILPYCGYESVWSKVETDYNQNPLPFRAPRHESIGRPISLFSCPDDPSSGIAWPYPNEKSELRIAMTSYLGNLGTNHIQHDGVVYVDSKVSHIQITDGTSTSLLAGELPASLDRKFGWWYSAAGQKGTGSLDFVLGSSEINTLGPDHGRYSLCKNLPVRFAQPAPNDYCSTFHFWSNHKSGANFAFCDGSVRFIKYNSSQSLNQMATRSGGEIISED